MTAIGHRSRVDALRKLKLSCYRSAPVFRTSSSMTYAFSRVVVYNETKLELIQLFTIFVGPSTLDLMHRLPHILPYGRPASVHASGRKSQGLPRDKGMRRKLDGRADTDLRGKSTPNVSADPNMSRSKGGVWEERLACEAS